MGSIYYPSRTTPTFNRLDIQKYEFVEQTETLKEIVLSMLKESRKLFHRYLRTPKRPQNWSGLFLIVYQMSEYTNIHEKKAASAVEGEAQAILYKMEDQMTPFVSHFSNFRKRCAK